MSSLPSLDSLMSFKPPRVHNTCDPIPSYEIPKDLDTSQHSEIHKIPNHNLEQLEEIKGSEKHDDKKHEKHDEKESSYNQELLYLDRIKNLESKLSKSKEKYDKMKKEKNKEISKLETKLSEKKEKYKRRLEASNEVALNQVKSSVKCEPEPKKEIPELTNESKIIYLNKETTLNSVLQWAYQMGVDSLKKV